MSNRNSSQLNYCFRVNPYRRQSLCQNSDYLSFLCLLFRVMGVDRLLRSEKGDPRASHEITPTKHQDKLEFSHSLCRVGGILGFLCQAAQQVWGNARSRLFELTFRP